MSLYLANKFVSSQTKINISSNLETDQSMSLMCLKQKNFGTADFIVGDNEV